jgi:hypothetical protein
MENVAFLKAIMAEMNTSMKANQEKVDTNNESEARYAGEDRQQ